MAILVLLALAACGTPAAAPIGGGAPATMESPQRTLVVAFRGEPPSLAFKPLIVVDGSVRGPIPFFNASLDALDERGVAYPYLADSLVQLDTPSWQVFPDG